MNTHTIVSLLNTRTNTHTHFLCSLTHIAALLVGGTTGFVLSGRATAQALHTRSAFPLSNVSEHTHTHAPPSQAQTHAAHTLRLLLDNVEGEAPEVRQLRRMAVLQMGAVAPLAAMVAYTPRLPPPALMPAPPPVVTKKKGVASKKKEGEVSRSGGGAANTCLN